MSRLTERMGSRVVTETLAVVLVLAMFAGGAALAQDAEEPADVDAVTQAEMLQDEGELEYRPQPGALGVLDPVAQAAWLEHQRTIEYADGLLRLTPTPYQWAGWLQAHRLIEYPVGPELYLAEVDQQ